MVGKACYKEINQLLNERLEEKKTLIAVHRGVWGGNIIENTIPAIDLVFQMGGDMAECDLSVSTDGDVYLFHDGHEEQLLDREKSILKMSSEEIDSCNYLNSLALPSGRHVQRFEEVLEHFNHGELINIDRSWRGGLQKALDVMKKYPHILKQALLKTPVKEEYLEIVDACPEKYMYMPIIYNLDELKKVLTYENINIVGVEIIARNDESELFKQEAIDWIHSQGLYVWVNTLVLSDKEKHVLYGSITDDKAVLESPSENWGVLMDRGVDIIQTDWPVVLKKYRDERMHEL